MNKLCGGRKGEGEEAMNRFFVFRVLKGRDDRDFAFRGRGPTDEELLGRALSAMSRLGENERMLSDPTWFRRSEDHERAIMELPGEYVHTNRG
ncbi:Peroxisome membrane protein, Pex16 [Artemisia annua]|uniref:Peroxisome membrane protein, Pex16 n=1 Tax=Artemisia annua TaxID=35608 RepID=A0A2U1PPJ1_ARTAN|nr:Peroxisome membrane protein, Pex16 [Artemisia annua]